MNQENKLWNFYYDELDCRLVQQLSVIRFWDEFKSNFYRSIFRYTEDLK